MRLPKVVKERLYLLDAPYPLVGSCAPDSIIKISCILTDACLT